MISSGLARHQPRRLHQERCPASIRPQHSLQDFVHVPAAEPLCEIHRIGRGDRLDDDRLHTPQRLSGDPQNVHALGIRQRRQRICTQHAIEVGDDLIERGDRAVHTSIQQGATDIQGRVSG